MILQDHVTSTDLARLEENAKVLQERGLLSSLHWG
jgi:hypothetical protein